MLAQLTLQSHRANASYNTERLASHIDLPQSIWCLWELPSALAVILLQRNQICLPQC